MTANILVDIPKPVSTSLGAAQPAVEASPGELRAFQAAAGMTVADCLLAYLDCEDVDAVFGIPGGNIASIVQGLRAHPRIRYIIASHEGGAAFMADGYARATGKLGVCLVTAGPGLLNALSGVASAHLDQVPLLLVSGQVSTDRFGLAARGERGCGQVTQAATIAKSACRRGRLRPINCRQIRTRARPSHRMSVSAATTNEKSAARRPCRALGFPTPYIFRMTSPKLKPAAWITSRFKMLS